ncbi:kinase-like domain-containing protein [Whalleya microplaca]|nr:kinase-like domain-containing protein [Whalleya microplaca]
MDDAPESTISTGVPSLRSSAVDAKPSHQPTAKVTADLEEQLYNCQLRNETGKLFIPEGELNRILDEDSVRQSLLQLSALYPDVNVEAYTRQICSKELPFRKVLAILMLLDMVEKIVTFVQFGISDEFLPMPDPRRLLSGEPPGSDAERWGKWKRLLESLPKNLYRTFHVLQWCALAPVFVTHGQVKHYTFTPDDTLPFLVSEHEAKVDAVADSESLGGRVRYGGFSEVRKVKIHPDHYRFGESEIRNPNHLFAVKRLLDPDREELAQEVEIFKRFLNLDDYYIIPLLMTYEIRQNIYDEFPSDYCLVFPWATGDLQSFWKVNSTLVGDRRIIPWISMQCYQLARAVSFIHNSSLDTGNDPLDSQTFYGRHGDIKPSNILWLSSDREGKYEDQGKLVLGDFGLTQFHRRSSRSDLTSSNLAASLTYRPPEIDNTGRISRSMDIWPLGCIFLEFIIWFLEGFDTLDDEFREARTESDIYGIRADTFFRIMGQGDSRIAILKPQVTSWFERLASNENCSRYLLDFLSIIQTDMLAVEPHRRIRASVLTQKLEQMHRKCTEDMDYYQISQSGSRVLSLVAASRTGSVAKPQKRHTVLRSWKQRLKNKFR